MGDHLIPFCDDLLDVKMTIVCDGAVSVYLMLEDRRASDMSGPSRKVCLAVSVIDYLVRYLQVPLVPNLLKEAPDDSLVLLGHTQLPFPY